MYDDLARSQRRGLLERFVVNAVIPSVLATFVLHAGTAGGQPEQLDLSGYYLVPLFTPVPVQESLLPYPKSAAAWCAQRADLDDATPILLSWTQVGWPGPLEGRVPGCVVLEGELTPSGRVDRSSILLVSATNPLLVIPARRTMMQLFVATQTEGQAIPTRVRIPFEFAIRVR